VKFEALPLGAAYAGVQAGIQRVGIPRVLNFAALQNFEAAK
jgi:hypothetical protein